MVIREITTSEWESDWNRLALHPLQSFEWGEFRKQTGVVVVRVGIFQNQKLVEPVQITIHRIPHTPFTIGYFPKGFEPSESQMQAIKMVARKYKCIFVKVESKCEKNETGNDDWLKRLGLVKAKSLFTPYNFVLDLTPSEEELERQMKQKTRYNIRLAEKKGVTAGIDNSDKAFEEYLRLMEETTTRQKFYAHNTKYHRAMWKVLKNSETTKNKLTAQLMTAKYEGKIVTTWILFRHNDTLYYPYGASSRENRQVMANNLVMWETIKLAKKWNLRYLDMWGALGPDPAKNDPWYGFHKFKEGYGARHVQYLGSYDYVEKKFLYLLYLMADKVRSAILRMH